MPIKKAIADSSNDDMKLLYIMSYLLLWLSGIVVYLIYGSRSKRIRFHSVQAFLYGVVWMVLEIIFGIISLFVGPIAFFFTLALLILWLYGLYVGYKAMDGIDMHITAIGEMAEKYS